MFVFGKQPLTLLHPQTSSSRHLHPTGGSLSSAGQVLPTAFVHWSALNLWLERTDFPNVLSSLMARARNIRLLILRPQGSCRGRLGGQMELGVCMC